MDARAARQTVDARFAAANPELPNGFAEHAPMGVDALLALGIDPAAAVDWAQRHQPVAIAADDPLSARRRVLLDTLAAGPWRDVVAGEVARLAPQVDAHLFHGLIRTAHAVRGLRDTPAVVGPDELGELATGLAAWHAWAERDRRARAAATGPRPADPRAAILDVARRAAGVCARQPTIVHLHGVTAPMAFLLLVEALGGALHDDTVAVAASAFEGTHARYPVPPPSSRTVAPGPSTLATLLDRWDAHPAKLTEAAMRGFHATGDGVFLEAIEAIIGPWPAPMPPPSPPTTSPTP